MNKIIKLVIFFILTSLFLNACQPNATSAKKAIIIGTTVGDFGDQVKDKIKPILEKQGYTVKLIEFTDYIKPNVALNEGDLDINVYQHIPYLREYQQNNKNNFIEIFEVPTAPLGLYSGKLKSLTDVHNNIAIAIPNDTANLSRTLQLIEDLSWIKLKKSKPDHNFTTQDIIANPYNIQFNQLEAAGLPRVRADVDYVVINGNYAVTASIPIDSALFQEHSTAYVNWGVIRKEDLDREWVKDITAAYNSPEFKEYAYIRFKGYAFPNSWKKDKQ